jgi:uncharacterized protein (DUF2062 family)
VRLLALLLVLAVAARTNLTIRAAGLVLTVPVTSLVIAAEVLTLAGITWLIAREFRRPVAVRTTWRHT